jgi:hypothetical protein
MYATAGGLQSITQQENAVNVEVYLHKVRNIVGADLRSALLLSKVSRMSASPRVGHSPINSRDRTLHFEYVKWQIYVKPAEDEPRVVAHVLMWRY